MTYHLISHHLCPYVQRAVIVLLEKGVAHRRTYIDLSNKPDWFHKVSPLGKVPVLESDGPAIFESQVIAEYVEEMTVGALHPANPLDRARHRSWIAYGSETLNAIGAFYSAPADTFEDKRQKLAGMFARMAEQVEGPFFDGPRFSMVDAAWAPVFRYLNVFDDLGDFGLLDGLDGMTRWRQNLHARPSVQQAVPDGYESRLREFLKARGSRLGEIARDAVVAA